MNIRFRLPAIILVLLSACRSEKSQPAAVAHVEFLELGDKFPSYDAYFTWENYEGNGNTEHAVYVWNGQPVGRGKEGFSRVASLIEDLPAGAKVLVFPTYDLASQMDASQEPRSYPWINYPVGTLDKLVERTGVTFYISPWDNQGKFCPECVPSTQPTGLSSFGKAES